MISSPRAVKIPFLSFKREDINVVMVTGYINTYPTLCCYEELFYFTITEAQFDFFVAENKMLSKRERAFIFVSDFCG